jgi:membrane protease subunit HflC
MNRFLLFVLLPIVLVAWGRTAFVAVDFSEYVTIVRFGDPITTIDGNADAGLHFKLPWPIDSVIRVDRRLQTFDLPATESLTRDPKTGTVDKTLTLDAYVTWKIPNAAAANQFIKSVGTPEQVKRILGPRITGRLAGIVSGMSLTELIEVADETKMRERTNRLNTLLLQDADGSPLPERVLRDYGIEIVSLRIRRLSYPESVRGSIYERIRSERSVRVADYENQGRTEAANILSKADYDRRVIEATARATKQTIEGQADVDADAIRNAAHARDPEFYAFLQKLKSLQVVFGESRDVILLSLKHELFDILRGPPPKAGTATTPTPGGKP